jgi:hypothetical protein
LAALASLLLIMTRNMAIKRVFYIASTAIFLAGCSTGIVPMGNDTYMVEHQGSSLSTQAENEAKCFQEANQFCEAKGLVMTPVSTTGRNGLAVPFGHGGDCKLVFRALPAGASKSGETPPVGHGQGPSLGQQLIDLQKAKEAGAITESEYEAQKAKLLGTK